MSEWVSFPRIFTENFSGIRSSFMKFFCSHFNMFRWDVRDFTLGTGACLAAFLYNRFLNPALLNSKEVLFPIYKKCCTNAHYDREKIWAEFHHVSAKSNTSFLPDSHGLFPFVRNTFPSASMRTVSPSFQDAMAGLSKSRILVRCFSRFIDGAACL